MGSVLGLRQRAGHNSSEGTGRDLRDKKFNCPAGTTSRGYARATKSVYSSPSPVGLTRSRSFGLAAFVPPWRDKFLSPFPKRLKSSPPGEDIPTADFGLTIGRSAKPVAVDRKTI